MSFSNFNNARYDSQRGNNSGYSTNRSNGFGAGYNRSNNGYQQVKKHSGSSTGTGRNNAQYISGWNLSKKGFISMISCPAKDCESSSKGKELKVGWERWVCSVEFKSREGIEKQKSTHTGFYNTAKRKLYIPDLTFVANPSAPNGGYFGSCRKPKR